MTSPPIARPSSPASTFVKANLSGQTALRVDAPLGVPGAVLQGMAEFALPDMIVREEEMATCLPALACRSVTQPRPSRCRCPTRAPFALAQIYDDEIETLARDAYARDYLMFGFDDWGSASARNRTRYAASLPE